jgi:hypothetical protein
LTTGLEKAMNEGLRPDEAVRALDEIDQRTEQVIKQTLIPRWFWWAIAGLELGLTAAVESRVPLVIGIGAGVFALGVLTVTGWVVVGTLRHAQLRRDMLGPAGALAIVSFVAAVLAVTLPTAFILEATGVRYPATLGTLPGAIVMVVGGPILMRHLRHIMLTNRTGGQR